MIKNIELDQTININIKNNIKAILDDNNLTLLQAINIFVNKINIDKALPFEIRVSAYKCHFVPCPLK